MTLQELLISELSKRHARELARMTVENPKILDELWTFALSENEPLNWRSAWVIKGIWEQHPALITPLIGDMILALPQLKKDGVKREFLRMIQEYPLPEDEEKLGILLNTCFEWLANPMEPIAVKIHSMTILFEIQKIIPEIREELITTVDAAMQEGSAGIINRGRKTIKAVRQNKSHL